jgi:FtsH-binding integral membrane protein
MSYAMEQPLAIRASESARAAFIRRTYGHLAAAILAFVAIELVMFTVLLPTREHAENLMRNVFVSPVAMLVLLVAFIGVGWLAQMWATSDTSRAVQYLGLGLYILLQAVIFVPILCIAIHYVNDPKILPTAGVLTLSLFAGLTATVFITRKDYSFLGPIISLGMCIAIGLVIAGLLFGFTLGLVFSFAMVALASAAILYDTSNIIHHYRTDQHVAAALGLFASVALLFFYILRILIAVSGSRD